MGAYTLDELIRRWQTGDLTAEQVIGQILLLLQELTARVRELERRQEKSGQARK